MRQLDCQTSIWETRIRISTQVWKLSGRTWASHGPPDLSHRIVVKITGPGLRIPFLPEHSLKVWATGEKKHSSVYKQALKKKKKI